MMRKKWNKGEQQKEDDLMWRLNTQADLLSWQYNVSNWGRILAQSEVVACTMIQVEVQEGT
jgi:hypothetical protein